MADWEDIGSWEDVGTTPKKGVLPSDKEQESYLENLKGLAETGLSLASGATTGTFGQIAGGLAGLMRYGVGTEEQRKKVEEAAAKGMESFTYSPRTEKGQEYTAKAGEAMQEAIPLMAHMPLLEGAMMATQGARALKNAAKAPIEAPVRPATLEEVIGQAEKAPENQLVGPRHPIETGWEDVTPAQPTAQPKNLRQGELSFGEVEVPAKYDKEGNPIPEAGTVRQQPPEVISVSQRGEAVPMTAEAAVERPPEIAIQRQLEAEQAARGAETKAAIERGETGNLFSDYINQHRDYELFRDENGRPLSRSQFDATVENLAKEPTARYVRPEDMDAAYSKYLANFDGVQAGLFDQPTTALEMAKVLKNDAAQRMRDNHPVVKAAERFVNEQQQFLDQLKQQGANAELIKDAARDVENAVVRLEKTRSNIEKGLTQALPKKPKKVVSPTGEITYMYEGLGETIKRVGAWTGLLSQGNHKANSPEALRNRVVEITPGETVQKYMPKGVQDKLHDYTRERRSAEDIAKDIKDNHIPDMKATPLSDKVQAGALYKQLETNNPIVRKTAAAISDADHNASANIRTFIADKKNGLAALFRNMNKKEVGEWWNARMVSEGEVNLSPEQMREMGMNEKQIKMNQRLDETMDFVFNRINETLARLGKEPISKRMGYLAGQMSGDFRRIIYKKGTDQVVGVIGNDVRHLVDSRVDAILADHPEWSAGPTETRRVGRRESRQKAFEDAVQMMTSENPEMKNLVDAYDKTLRDDAYNYMNAKKHTMQKKGVFGMEGFKRDVDSFTNAKQGMESQIRYIEKMMKWAEMSKAVEEIRPLLRDDSINMPNAKKWSNDYIDRALGIQTSKVGQAVDGLIQAVGESVGVGPSAIERGLSTTKNAISKTLLGFLNPAFLAINLLQPATSLPAMNSLLRARGLEHASAIGLPGNIMSFMKMYQDGKMGALTSFERQIKAEGQARNIFGSEIFDHSTNLSRANAAFNRVAEIGIPKVEEVTRGFVFTHFSKILEKNGYKGRNLFDIAENLTNQAMTDYRTIEAPSIYKEMGALGEMAVTLQRYKHNTLSNMAMLAREAKNNGNYRPIITALATGMAFSGLTGMLGFNEADKAYQIISKEMGKPDTLTRLAMDKLPDSVNFGVLSTLSNIDLSKRFGMQLFPDSASGALFPGVSKLADIGSAALDYSTAGSPEESEIRGSRLLQQMAPGIARGALEVKNFQDESGMAHNPRTLEATYQRNDFDTGAKLAGVTSLDESKIKARLYQEQLVDKAYSEKRQSLTNKMFEDLYRVRQQPEKIAEYFESGRGQKMLKDFVQVEGNLDNVLSAVQAFQEKTMLSAETRKKLAMAAAAESGKEGDTLRAKRYAEMLNK